MSDRDLDPTPILAGSDLFDRDWYLAQNPDVSAAGVDPLEHYLRFGAAEGRNPSPRFNATWYLNQYRDVRESGMNPLVHFVRHGRSEGRRAGPDWGIPADICGRIKACRSSAKSERQRIAVCTAIIADYDTLMVPHQLDSKIAYVCFTDGAPEPYGVWNCRPAPRHYPDPRRTARYIKTHLTELLPDYHHAVWIDGNVLIRGDIRKYVEAAEHRALAMGVVSHPLRDCVYEEAEACKALKQDPDEVIDRQMERYRQAGVPPHAGLFATSLHIAHLGHPLTAAFYRLWWQEIASYSCRDQLSVGWALKESRVPFGSLLPPGG